MDDSMLQTLLRLQSAGGASNDFSNPNASNNLMMDKMMGGIGPSNLEAMMMMNNQSQQDLQQQQQQQQPSMSPGFPSDPFLLQQFLNHKQQQQQQQLQKQQMMNKQFQLLSNSRNSNHSFSQLPGLHPSLSSGTSFSNIMMRSNQDFTIGGVTGGGIMRNQAWGDIDDLSPFGACRPIINSNNCSNSNGNSRFSNLISSLGFQSQSNNNNRGGEGMMNMIMMNNNNSIKNINPLLQKVGMVSPMSAMSGGDQLHFQQQQQQQQQVSLMNADLTTSSSTHNTNSNTSNSSTVFGDMTGKGDPYAENGILGPWSVHAAGLLGNMMQESAEADEKNKNKSRKKPKDKPKRPLSAYNIFFKEERNRILEELPVQEKTPSMTVGEDGTTILPPKPTRKRKKAAHGKIGFESLAKLIGRRWQDLDEDRMMIYKTKAEQDMARYKKEMAIYKANTIGGTTSSTNNITGGTNSNNGSTGSLSSTGTNSSCVNHTSNNNTNNTHMTMNMNMKMKNKSFLVVDNDEDEDNPNDSSLLLEPKPMGDRRFVHSGSTMSTTMKHGDLLAAAAVLGGGVGGVGCGDINNSTSTSTSSPSFKKARLDSDIFRLDDDN